MAIRLNNLALLLKVTNRLAEAEPSMRRALAIFEESLGAEHPSTKTVRENLEALLAELEAAKERVAEAPLTRPQSGHPLPQGERVTARRGLFGR